MDETRNKYSPISGDPEAGKGWEKSKTAALAMLPELLAQTEKQYTAEQIEPVAQLMAFHPSIEQIVAKYLSALEKRTQILGTTPQEREHSQAQASLLARALLEETASIKEKGQSPRQRNLK